VSALNGRPASERIRLNLPIGSGRSLAMCAAAVACDFATAFLDHPRGRNHLVIYPEIAAGYCAAVWWTDTGSVSVEVRPTGVLS
jgi:hypothetical protein